MDDFSPNNELERSLMEAAADAGKRPAFYHRLLDSDLIVLGETNHPGQGGFVAGDDTKLRLVTWRHDGKPVIAVFSSLPRLHEAIKREANYVQLGARTLFTMLGDSAPIVLNPSSAYGKEFTQEEIASLLDGSIFNLPQQIVTEQEQQVLMSQPANYPDKLVAGLKSLFTQHPEVESAYLAQIYNPALPDQGSHPIIGLKVEGDPAQLISDAGIVVHDTTEPHQIVDFIQMGEGSPSSYLERTEPFYVRGGS